MFVGGELGQLWNANEIDNFKFGDWKRICEKKHEYFETCIDILRKCGIINI